MEDTKPTIKIGEKGPLIIKGGVTLIYSDGSEEIKEKNSCSMPLWTLRQKTIL